MYLNLDPTFGTGEVSGRHRKGHLADEDALGRADEERADEERAAAVGAAILSDLGAGRPMKTQANAEKEGEEVRGKERILRLNQALPFKSVGSR